MDWPPIIRELAATDGSSLRRHFLGEHAEWGPHQENTARLLDAQAYWLDWEWQEKAVGPNDPQVRRARAEARRRGTRTPRRPLIPPVAARPRGVHEQHLLEYLEQVAELSAPAAHRVVTLDEFDEVIETM